VRPTTTNPETKRLLHASFNSGRVANGNSEKPKIRKEYDQGGDCPQTLAFCIKKTGGKGGLRAEKAKTEEKQAASYSRRNYQQQRERKDRNVWKEDVRERDVFP